MKVQRLCITKNHYIWLVLDDNYLPIEPIESFTRYLHYTEKSPNTILSYAHHLKLYWEYLKLNEKNWQKVKLTDFSSFVHWLRNTENIFCLKNGSTFQRSERTVNTILSAIASFYRYHNQLGNTDIKLTETCYSPANRHKSLLYHIFKHKPMWMRVISLKTSTVPPKILNKNEVSKVLNSCLNTRDSFLIKLLYETGIRIGQALALKHEDIKSWDSEIHIIFRKDHPNLARNKSHKPNIIHVSQELMQLYSEYIQVYADIISRNEYVFINLQTKIPLTYSATRKLFERLSKKTNIKITPHMFRHTHATELIKHGWDAAWVQKRLGHANVQTTIDTYLHLNDQDLKEAFQSYQEGKNKGEML